MTEHPRADLAPPALWRGAAAGLVAGIVASFAMDAFQSAVSALSSDDDGGEKPEPATDKAADAVATAVTGDPLSDAARPFGGQVVHYAVGAALGVGYGVVAEYRPAVTTGGGTVFGAATVAILDETIVPAVGLGSAPWQAPAGSHLYALASHLVFGAIMEFVRGRIRRSFDPAT